MSTDLYVLFDVANDKVLDGPRVLPSNLIDLSIQELNDIHWYLVLPYEYDIGADYDPNAFKGIAVDYIYVEEPYKAIRRFVTTEPKDLDAVKAYVRLKITEFRNQLFDSGFLYSGVLFDSDVESRLNWTAAAATVLIDAYLHDIPSEQLKLITHGEAWTRRDNKTALFTPYEILTCGRALGAWAAACYKYCRQLKDLVLIAEDFETAWGYWVNNDISNWPNPDLGGEFLLPQPE